MKPFQNVHNDPEHENLDWEKLRAHLFAGALARVTAASLLFPVDTVKARLQFQPKPKVGANPTFTVRRTYKGMTDAFFTIAREEGKLALFRGLPIRLIYVTPSAAVSFALYEQFKRMLRNHQNSSSSPPTFPEISRLGASKEKDEQDHPPQSNNSTTYEPLIWLTAGAAARLIGTAVRTPFDIVKQRMQVQGSLKVPGYRGLFQGYISTMMRDVPFAGLYFSSYESFKYVQRVYLLKDGDESSQLTHIHHLFAGALAGAFASVCTLPMDVVKLNIQTQNTLPLHERRFHSVFHAWKMIYATEGIPGFFKGWGPVLFKVTPAASVTFACYEAYKSYFESR